MEWEDEEGNLQSPLLSHDDGAGGGKYNQDKQPLALAPANRSINSHYGHRVGALLTLSLAVSTGFIVYAHLGLSAVILSNQNIHLGNADQSIVSRRSPRKCNAHDEEIWTAVQRETSRPENSDHCPRTHGESISGCLLDSDCIVTCFDEKYGYSPECSGCFTDVPACSMRNGCVTACSGRDLRDKCRECNSPCIKALEICTGLPNLDANNEAPSLPDDVLGTATSAGNGKSMRGEGACQNSDLEAIQKWYTVYNLTYPKSIRAAWNGGAKLLSVIIVVFSGIWPYLKNIMLLAVWYVPSTTARRTAVIHWLSCLSKYTLVDVFAVMGAIVGIQLQLKIPLMGELVTRAEPRFGIISFFVATVWACLHIELIKELHERAISGEESLEERRENEGPTRRPASPYLSPILLAVSIGLYVWGAMSEMVVISSRGCDKSYNLVTLANAIVNEHSMAGNSANSLTWILYLSYVVLILVMPMLAHLLQASFLFGWLRSREMRDIVRWTSAVWNFACVEVLLIGVFAMEYKYSHLIKKIVGDSNAQFLDVGSKLSSGFYILIFYSVSSNFLQCFLGLCLNSESPDGTAQVLYDHKII